MRRRARARGPRGPVFGLGRMGRIGRPPTPALASRRGVRTGSVVAVPRDGDASGGPAPSATRVGPPA